LSFWRNVGGSRPNPLHGLSGLQKAISATVLWPGESQKTTAHRGEASRSEWGHGLTPGCAYAGLKASDGLEASCWASIKAVLRGCPRDLADFPTASAERDRLRPTACETAEGPEAPSARRPALCNCSRCTRLMWKRHGAARGVRSRAADRREVEHEWAAYKGPGRRTCGSPDRCGTLTSATGR